MTATNSPLGNGNAEATSTPRRAADEDARQVVIVNNADASSTMHAEVMSNADLYTVTPPAYTQSIAEGEMTVDAEEAREEKSHIPERSIERDVLASASPRAMSDYSDPRPATPLQAQQELSQEDTALHVPIKSAPPLGHYLIDPAVTALLVGARACSILPDRLAIWLVKNKKMALSPLAAAVLTKEGLLSPKDLELISQHPSTRRDPTDPLSGIMLGVYDTLGEITLGLVAGPVELGRQATPILTRFESRQRDNPDGNTQPVTTDDVKGAPQAAAKVAVEASKGLGRVVTASLKMPVLTLHGITRGFHNIPKLYGEDVREYENVTGLKSGLRVSAKSFGHGLSDGLMDLVAKPIQGAEKNGIVGFASGCAKGLGNAMFKPTAGACGLLSYSFVGAYKEIRNIKVSERNKCPADLVRTLGEAEYHQATDADRLYVVRVWCQTMMRVRLV